MNFMDQPQPSLSGRGTGSGVPILGRDPTGDATVLVLWDIDGTLLESAGEGKRAFYAALDRMFPARHWPDLDMAGRTDFGIWRELLAAASVLDPPPFSAFASVYAPIMEDHFLRRPPTALKGAIELCRRLDDHPRFHNGLVTGNHFEGTRVKLRSLDVWDLFAREGSPVGGYGDHVPDKGPLAREALDEWNRRFPGRLARSVVVGDTPEDVRCAKVAGVACLGVATGRFSEADLLECGAEAVVPNLSNTEDIVSLLDRIAT